MPSFKSSFSFQTFLMPLLTCTLCRKYVRRSFIIKYLERLIPNSLKRILKKIYYVPLDAIDRLKGRDSMIPPRSMILFSRDLFKQVGQEFRGYFIELANLQPNNRVLDVGCGIGRMAIPLTNYLSQKGEYWGFDIGKKGIEWCQNHISTKFSNFHFQHCDVYNKHYNPRGRVPAQNFQFPLEENFFDFVFLTSVFTHMLPSDLDNYAGEISRVLKTKGKCLITFFLLNEESETLVRSGDSSLDFRYKVEGCLTIKRKDPETAIAYDEKFINGLFEKYRLKIVQPVYYGSWCNRDSFLSYQDLIIATKSLSN
ncbi:class I SAM-dependent methyltransferase [Thermodesulfobacteriota bacterium]